MARKQSTTASTPPDREGAAIARDLLAWYDRHRRALPWRALPGGVSDPYAVWLSEIMLQQTTVAAVKPFFARFLATWPRVGDLAAADLDDVMRAWAGLGYYSRARNLHACARTVANLHGGRFPETEAELRTLPGVGDYTAAAIAAIAFGQPAAVVDGNVERVMTRLHALDAPLPGARPVVRARMGEATPRDRPGDFAQAVMDLGATICTSRSPACAICPLMARCAARRAGTQGDYPVRQAKTVRAARHGTAYYIRNGRGDVLLRTRAPAGLLGGMAELPGTAWVEGEPPAEAAARPGYAGRVKHVFTHFTLLLDVVVAAPSHWPDLDTAFGSATRWVPPAEVSREALPTLMRRAVALAEAQSSRSDIAGASVS